MLAGERVERMIGGRAERRTVKRRRERGREIEREREKRETSGAVREEMSVVERV